MTREKRKAKVVDKDGNPIEDAKVIRSDGWLPFIGKGGVPMEFKPEGGAKRKKKKAKKKRK